MKKEGSVPWAALVAQVEQLTPRHHYGDRIWDLYLPVRGRWRAFWMKEYEGKYYLSGSDLETVSSDEEFRAHNQSFSYNDNADKEAVLLKALPHALSKMVAQVRKDPIEYYRLMNRSVPPALRMGVIPKKIVQRLIPEYMRFDQELSKAEVKRMIDFLLNRRGQQTSPSMTANLYFDYCKFAYLASVSSHKGLNRKSSGRELYLRWADGRTGGLEKIAPDSAGAFAKWYEGKSWSGCHPWEIYRGGNSTHIDLSVFRDNPKAEWRVMLSGFSSTRLVEVCRIVLALDKAGFRFELGDWESYLARLTATDWIGVVPECEPIKYAFQAFPDKWHVADCIHYSWFKNEQGKSKLPLRKVRSLVTWFPLSAPTCIEN